MGDRDVTVDILANDKTAKDTKSAGDNFDKLNQRTKRAVKEIESLPIGAIGGKAGNEFVKGMLKPLAGLGGQAAPIFAAVGIGAAPLIGAAVSGAIIGGAGIGGVVGGLVIASRDARVQAAADVVGKRVEARLEKAGGAFVQPAIDGLAIIGESVDSIDLEGIFRDSSRYVVPLAEGVGRAIERMGDGLESLIRNAGPSIDSIADGIALIGDSIGDGLESLADNGESSADALRTVFAIIDSSVDSVFTVVNALTELYEINQKIGGDAALRLLLKAMGQDLDVVGKNGRIAGSGTFAASDGIQKAGEAAEGAVPPVKTLAERMADAAEAALDLFDSTTDVEGALDRATEAAGQNGETLSANSEKGRENRTALSRVARALRENYERYVEVNGAGGQASQVAEANRRAFVKSARQFGLTAKEAEELADKILGIPTRRDTRADFDAAGAKASIRSYRNSINSIPRTRRTTVEIAAVVTGSNLGKSALNSALRKQSLKFDAMGSFAEIDPAGGFRSRTGGPTPVNVTSEVGVSVSLDGAPFARAISTVVSESERRTAWRQKVGTR